MRNKNPGQNLCQKESYLSVRALGCVGFDKLFEVDRKGKAEYAALSLEVTRQKSRKSPIREPRTIR